MPLLSHSARRRLLDEVRQRMLLRLTRDPAMPGPLRRLIEALFRIFWVDIELEIEQDGDDTSDATERLRSEDEAAAAPAIARGTLQVLAVEARNLAPAHGIGTNPYIVGFLGQQVRRSWTAWSNLNPAWNFLMEFSVVSLSGSLELEVLSHAPLFGSDTRLGYVSLPLSGITQPVSGGKQGAHLAYRREQLQGSTQGEVVLILDYKPHQHSRGPTGLVRQASARLWRCAAQFRAFFLYHYWPCDKSIFQMYLREPVDILLLLVSLSPFVAIRAAFYTVLLLCLCIPWPPDEHQVVQFMLAFKGTAVLTDGAGRMAYGILVYYSCVRAGTCTACGTPGSGVGAISISCELYQEILIWFVCFLVLPRTVTYRMRAGAQGSGAGIDSDTDASRGGRMRVLLLYNLACFGASLGVFLALSARDLLWPSGAEEAWRCRISENFFWSRTLFGLLMYPFLFLLHPQINKLLTHSTPTGFTRLGTLRRYNPRLRPRRQKCEEVSAVSFPHQQQPGPQQLAADSSHQAHAVDPVEDLKNAIRWFPGGSLALFAGGLALRGVGAAASVAGAVVAVELRIANSAVSVGLRAVDVGVSGAHRVAQSSLGEAVVAGSARAVRAFPCGGLALDTASQVLSAVGFLAADAETQGIAAAEKLLREASGQAEALKLEAASRLAEMLSRAERLAEREAAELIERVRPELGKISHALRKRRAGVRAAYLRGCDAACTLSQSLLALSWDLALRLPVAGATLARAFERELGDLQAQRAERSPGWMPMVEAYSRLVCSCITEGLLELKPAIEVAMPERGHRAQRPAGLPPLEAAATGSGSAGLGAQSKVGAAQSAPLCQEARSASPPCEREEEAATPQSGGVRRRSATTNPDDASPRCAWSARTT